MFSCKCPSKKYACSFSSDITVSARLRSGRFGNWDVSIHSFSFKDIDQKNWSLSVT